MGYDAGTLIPSPPSTEPELRPLGLGELVDRAVRFWRRHLGPLFKLFLGFQLVIFVVSKGYVLLAGRWFPLFGGDARRVEETLGTDPESLLRQAVLGGAALCVVLGLYLWVSWLFSVAGTRYMVDSLLGRPTSIGDGLRQMWRRLGTVTLAFVLSTLWGLVVCLISMLPGALLSAAGLAWARSSPAGAVLAVFGGGLVILGMLVAALWYMLRFLLTAQVLAMEDKGTLAALRRSGELVSGRVGEGVLGLVKVRATILVTAVAAILLSVGMLAGLPAFIISAVYGNLFDPSQANPDAIPQALLVPAELLQVAAQAVFSPLYLTFTAILYVDMRVRREGLDLELKLARLP